MSRTTCCQFHQRFSYKIFGAKISNLKASFVVFGAKILYKKHTRKMSMKLTIGYSFCLRANIWTFNTSLLIEFDKVQLMLLGLLGKPSITILHNGAYQNFELKGNVKLFSLFWNAICVSYNLKEMSLDITVNGILVLNITESSPIKLTKIAESSFKLGDETFSGQISDFNFWSRPLFPKEAVQYSIECKPNFLEISKPDIVKWSSANLTNQGKSVEKVMIQSEIFCSRSTLFLGPRFDSIYESASNFCTRLNGNLFFPKNESVIENLILNMGKSIISEVCKNKLWVPVIRSKFNSTKWVFDSQTRPEREVYLEPWGKQKNIDIETNQGDCMYFNIVEKKYVETSCKSFPTAICSFCQLEESRQTFTLKSSCKIKFSETSYYLIDGQTDYKFIGFNGWTRIFQKFNPEMDVYWYIDSMSQSSELQVNELPSLVAPVPFGIFGWQSKFVCKGDNQLGNIINLKLTNVSKQQ